MIGARASFVLAMVLAALVERRAGPFHQSSVLTCRPPSFADL
jgi:hypothetical protein